MKVFVSHAQEDTQRATPICQALAAWQLTYWAPERGELSPEQSLVIQRGLIQADIFLRICTANTSRSYWMTFEQTAYLAAQAEEYRSTGHLARKLINLIMDTSYKVLPFDYADTIVDATDVRNPGWREALYAAILASPPAGL
jgi:TIR domain